LEISNVDKKLKKINDSNTYNNDDENNENDDLKFADAAVNFI
jgi:hypothetical protein